MTPNNNTPSVKPAISPPQGSDTAPEAQAAPGTRARPEKPPAGITTEIITSAPDTAAQRPDDTDDLAVRALSEAEESLPPDISVKPLEVGIRPARKRRLLPRVLLSVAAAALIAVALYGFWVFYT
ncbi:MAG: hypothetical protein LBQ91_01005, partial [Oscillospiraceae bacterium]|nr:hypothetical protein [Oscillospiraceae bacterium]